MTPYLPWILFGIAITVLLCLDLFVFHKKNHEVKVKEALLWTAFWISLALAFNVGVYFVKGKEAALAFLTGYLIEESLSVDNLFVFLLIFQHFHVQRMYQHKILFWGILGAIFLRLLFIMTGIELIERFHWMIYVLGGVLIISGLRLFTEKDKHIEPEKSKLLHWISCVIPMTKKMDGGKFFTIANGKRVATPLFLVLLSIEFTDVVFALDSIPAILAITRDPFIVFTSNIFAILGLRSLYFALAGIMELFHYLHYGLGFILIYVGGKMILSHYIHIPTFLSLGVIGATLALTITLSLLLPHKKINLEKKVN